MTLANALKKSKIVRRSKWDIYGTILDTGVTFLFCYTEKNTNLTQRLTLEDVLATDWTSRY